MIEVTLNANNSVNCIKDLHEANAHGDQIALSPSFPQASPPPVSIQIRKIQFLFTPLVYSSKHKRIICGI